MVNSANFTKRLEKILDYYGLSATSFAEKISFNRSTISHLLSGRNKPSLEFVMKLVQTFPEVELYWLLNGKGNFPPISGRALNKQDSFKEVEEKRNTEVILPSAQKKEEPHITHPIPKGDCTNEIERIILFYKNGSFKEYLP